MDGGGIELVSADDREVKLKLSGACARCPMSQYTLANIVEATLKEKVPELKEVILVDDIRDRFRRGEICCYNQGGDKKCENAKNVEKKRNIQRSLMGKCCAGIVM